MQTRHAKKVSDLQQRIRSLNDQHNVRALGHVLPRVAVDVTPNSALTTEDDFDRLSSFRQNLGLKQRLTNARKIDAANRKLSRNLKGIWSRQGTYSIETMKRESEALERYKRARSAVRQRKYGTSGGAGKGGPPRRTKSSVTHGTVLARARHLKPVRLVIGTRRHVSVAAAMAAKRRKQRSKSGSKSVGSSPSRQAGGMSSADFHKMYSPSKEKLTQSALELGFELLPEPSALEKAATDAVVAAVEAAKARDPRQAKYWLHYSVPQHSKQAAQLLEHMKQSKQQKYRKMTSTLTAGDDDFGETDNKGGSDGNEEVADGFLPDLFIESQDDGTLTVEAEKTESQVVPLPPVSSHRDDAADDRSGGRPVLSVHGDHVESDVASDASYSGAYSEENYSEDDEFDNDVESDGASGADDAKTRQPLKKSELLDGLQQAILTAEKSRNRFPLMAAVRRVVAAGFKYEKILLKAVNLVKGLAKEASTCTDGEALAL